eukprot:7300232-Lingulodinium_polyedra.AAC.1
MHPRNCAAIEMEWASASPTNYLFWLSSYTSYVGQPICKFPEATLILKLLSNDMNHVLVVASFSLQPRGLRGVD